MVLHLWKLIVRRKAKAKIKVAKTKAKVASNEKAKAKVASSEKEKAKAASNQREKAKVAIPLARAASKAKRPVCAITASVRATLRGTVG